MTHAFLKALKDCKSKMRPGDSRRQGATFETSKKGTLKVRFLEKKDKTRKGIFDKMSKGAL